MSSAFNTYSQLTVDLDAIASNYQFLRSQVGTSLCAAVLKADAYGCGIEAVAPALYNSGCRHFFTAYTDEAIVLKNVLSSFQQKTFIYVLNGPYLKGWTDFYKQNNLIPVLNNLFEIEEWHAYAKIIDQRLPAILHINTGMNRHGLPLNDYQAFLNKDWPLIDWKFVMSHLSCSDQPNHPANVKQLKSMQAIQKDFPKTPLCFANSNGIFLGSNYHFNMVRPGISLYGLNSVLEQRNKLAPTLELKSRIVQIQDIKPGDYVGYSESYQAKSPMRLATLAIGYADGVPWRISNQGVYVHIKENIKAPIVGRISMDLMTIDITHVSDVQVGEWVTLLDKVISIDDWANFAGTINHEILLKLGKRMRRNYNIDCYNQIEAVSC